MLFDSSVWIDYLKGTKTPLTDLLDKKLDFFREPDVHLCPPIFQEVLQGIRQNEKYDSIKELLMTCHFLNLDSYYSAEMASGIYRLLRSKGMTIRKPNDCLIAFYAIHFNIKLAHNDKDFDKIAKHTALKIYAT